MRPKRQPEGTVRRVLRINHKLKEKQKQYQEQSKRGGRGGDIVGREIGYHREGRQDCAQSKKNGQMGAKQNESLKGQKQGLGRMGRGIFGKRGARSNDLRRIRETTWNRGIRGECGRTGLDVICFNNRWMGDGG